MSNIKWYILGGVIIVALFIIGNATYVPFEAKTCEAKRLDTFMTKCMESDRSIYSCKSVGIDLYCK